MYDGTLVMPRNCVAMGNDEMMYLEGGFDATRTSYGYKMHFSSKDINKLQGTKASAACDVLGISSTILGGFGIAAGTVAAGSLLGLIGSAIVAAKYEMIACNKINKGDGAYFRMLMNGAGPAVKFNGLGAITPW